LKGHWDEELHGMDYLVYAYLQQANDEKALEQMEYLKTINEVFPEDFKDAYSFAAMPARHALERKDWVEAARLELSPSGFPWEKFPWEKANVNFGRLLGAVHTNNLVAARNELKQLRLIHQKLSEAKENYKANLVLIQITSSEAWIEFAEGRKTEALNLMSNAADREDATEKEAVTPGEVVPARELLGDMYLEMGESQKALEAYQADLERRPNRFNALFGAGRAEENLGDMESAMQYYKQLLAITSLSNSRRPELMLVRSFVKNNS